MSLGLLGGVDGDYEAESVMGPCRAAVLVFPESLSSVMVCDRGGGARGTALFGGSEPMTMELPAARLTSRRAGFVYLCFCMKWIQIFITAGRRLVNMY